MEEMVEKLEEYLETHELSAEPLFIVPTKEGWAIMVNGIAYYIDTEEWKVNRYEAYMDEFFLKDDEMGENNPVRFKNRMYESIMEDSKEVLDKNVFNDDFWEKW